jgi:hypothetical protein
MRPMMKVAGGTWYYDGNVPRRIDIYAVPVEFAGSRYDDEDHLDEASPIPETADGHVYVTAYGGECESLEEARKWADRQPWGPVKWDTEPKSTNEK